MTWARAWDEGRTPWDAGASAPALGECLDAEFFCGAKPTRALVTGCGSGWDVFEFAARGVRATGLDVAPGVVPRFGALRDQRTIDPSMARLAIGDFFTWSPPERFDAIWDYTFLCAIDPRVRHRWVARMKELLSPDGVLAMLIFPDVDKPLDEGPPFVLNPEIARGLMSEVFEEVRCERPASSHPGREGNEWLAVWKPRRS